MTKEAHAAARATRSTWGKDFSQRCQTTERETRRPLSTQLCWTNLKITPWQISHNGVGDHRRTADSTNLLDQTEWSQTSQTADQVVVNHGADDPDLPRTNDHEVAHFWVVALEVSGMNCRVVSYHKVVLKEATPEDKEQRQNHSQKSQWWKEINERSRVILPKKEHRSEELGRRRAEDPRESHSAEKQAEEQSQQQTEEQNQQQKNIPNNKYKSIPNSKGASKEQKEQCQL